MKLIYGIEPLDTCIDGEFPFAFIYFNQLVTIGDGCYDVGDITFGCTPKIFKHIFLRTPGVFKLNVHFNLLGVERINSSYGWTNLGKQIATIVSINLKDRPIIAELPIKEFKKQYPFSNELRSSPQ